MLRLDVVTGLGPTNKVFRGSMVPSSKLLLVLLFSLLAQTKAFAINIYEQTEKAIQLGKEEKYIQAAEEMEAFLANLNDSDGENNPRFSQAYIAYLRLLAYFYLQQQNPQNALKALQMALYSQHYKTYLSSNPQKFDLNRDRFLQWYLLKLDKDHEEAKRIISFYLSTALERGQDCNTEIAEYLLDKIDRNTFLTKNRKLASKCQFMGESSQALVYFWIGVKAHLAEETNLRNEFLTLFLKNSSQEDILERGVAFNILQIPPQSRQKYIKQSNDTISDCICKMSVN